MKNRITKLSAGLIITLAHLLISTLVFAQAPEKMSYQAVIRNGTSALITSTQVGMQISILQGSVTGTAVYVETQTPTTNVNGLATLEIGTGTVISGNFATIDWAAGPYFIKTETDPLGGPVYTITGTSQLMSIPYALYSKVAGSAANDLVNDADSVVGNEYNTGVLLNGTNLETTDLGGTITTDLSSLVDDADADSTNEYNTGVVLNGTNLETTDGGGTIITDLSSLSGGSSNWTVSGNNIRNSNSGLVAVGFTSPFHTLSVGKTDTTTALGLGFVGAFNNVNSGKLVFSEDLSFNGDCGMMFQHNGALNNLHLIGGCTTFGDTIVRFNRSGFTNIKQLRVGTNILTNASNPLSVNGNSDFTGDMTITGNLNVTGNIAKGGGTFKIDHPLDPANKYLVHSFVESPEMMNIFSGNIVTDANGYATVELPSYFEAANKDFRYQLTVIGTFAQAIIKEKISDNKFLIQTNQPNTEVSWSVTGIRSDKYANSNRVVDEVEKELKGTYIHPELYGASSDVSENAVKERVALEQEAITNDADK